MPRIQRHMRFDSRSLVTKILMKLFKLVVPVTRNLHLYGEVVTVNYRKFENCEFKHCVFANLEMVFFVHCRFVVARKFPLLTDSNRVSIDNTCRIMIVDSVIDDAEDS